MPASGSVTVWIEQLKAGESAAAEQLWEGYFRRLVALAPPPPARPALAAADEEDVALSAFDSFCRNAEQGRFPQLLDRDDLLATPGLAGRPARRARLARHEYRPVEARRRGRAARLRLWRATTRTKWPGSSAGSRRRSSPPKWRRTAAGCWTVWGTRICGRSPWPKWRATATLRSPPGWGWWSGPSSAAWESSANCGATWRMGNERIEAVVAGGPVTIR